MTDQKTPIRVPDDIRPQYDDLILKIATERRFRREMQEATNDVAATWAEEKFCPVDGYAFAQEVSTRVHFIGTDPKPNIGAEARMRDVVDSLPRYHDPESGETVLAKEDFADAVREWVRVCDLRTSGLVAQVSNLLAEAQEQAS